MEQESDENGLSYNRSGLQEPLEITKTRFGGHEIGLTIIVIKDLSRINNLLRSVQQNLITKTVIKTDRQLNQVNQVD